MSYDRLKENHQGPVISQEQLREDKEREAFLRRLDAADYAVTDFEAEFLNGFLGGRWFWTDRRRLACDKMMKKYGGHS